MKRVLSALAVTGLLAAAFFLDRLPSEAADLGEALAAAPPTAASCPVLVDRSGGGVLDAGSSVRGRIRITASAASREIGSVDRAIDDAGGLEVPLEQVVAGGAAAALVELPTSEASAAVVQRGSGGLAASRCTSPGTGSLVIAGASTRSGEALELQLVNPYSVDAVVSVTSASEAGIDSATELESVIVPAHSIVTRDLAQLLALRNSLAITVLVQTGAVHAFALQSGEGDRMLLEGVAPAQEWWVPVPVVEGAAARLVVASAAPLDAEFQLDLVTSSGQQESAVSDVVAAGALADLPLEELGEDVRAVRLFATAPVVAAVVLEREGVRAGSAGAPQLAAGWLVPGVTAGASGGIWLYNPGDVEAEAVLQPLAPDSQGVPVVVPAGAVVSHLVEDKGSGYVVRSSSALAVTAVVADENGVALLSGTPLEEFDG